MAYWLLLVAAAIIIFVLLFVYDITRDAFYDKNFKGPKMMPFFGHVMRMKTQDLAELNRQHQADVETYGSPVRYKFLWQYLLHISTPEHFEAIMKHSTNIAKPLFYAPLLPWLHRGLLTSDGDKWRNRRKLLTPAFHFQILREFHAAFNEHAAGLVRHVQNRIAAKPPGDVIDMAPIITMSTLDIICETAMGRTVNALEALEAGTTSPYVKALIELGDHVIKRTYSTWLFINNFVYMTLSEDGRKTKQCLNVLHAFTRETIAEREKNLPSSEELKSGGKRRLAFLDLLLDMKRDGSLSANDVAEETDTFMFEGHDTTSTALMWIMLTLGTFKDCQKKCQEEIDTVLGNFTEISPEQLSQLSYLERCIKETQRIRPSVPMIGRRVDHDMNLDNHTMVKRGATIQMNILTLHRNPEHWPEPDRFDPDRFLPDNVAKRHPFAFAPFSAGPRNCIGQKFAMTEMKMIMAYLLAAFTWDTVHPLEDIHGALMMVLRPESGVKIVIRPRH